MGAALDETLKPSSDQGDMLADIPPTSRKKNSVQGQGFSRFKTFEEKLRYYKELRNDNKISEGDYQKKKRELLNRF